MIIRSGEDMRMRGTLGFNSESGEGSVKTTVVFMPKRLGENAVVIGGSLAGLMTARVLADHFESVTVLERDHIESRPALHKSIPHGNHLHGLLLGGQQVMASLFPN